MKKLLSILGEIFLVGIASTNIIACGGGETPTPPVQRTDLKGLTDTNSITLKNTNKTVTDYQNSLLNELKKSLVLIKYNYLMLILLNLTAILYKIVTLNKAH